MTDNTATGATAGEFDLTILFRHVTRRRKRPEGAHR